jgi:antitoxin component of MazEF toxin-antitoxin module
MQCWNVCAEPTKTPNVRLAGVGIGRCSGPRVDLGLEVAMDPIRKTGDGIFIPNSLLRGLGDDLSIEIAGDALIVESAERRVARNKLRQMLRQLQRCGRDPARLTEQEVRGEIDKVRVKRARHS